MEEKLPDEHNIYAFVPEPQPEKSKPLKAYESLGQFLNNDLWQPQEIKDKRAYRVHYPGAHGDLVCYAQIMLELELFLFYAIAPVSVPREVRPLVAEFITRANYGLRLGNFEMDYADGEVRYRCTVDFEGRALSNDLVRRAIYTAVQTLDTYLPSLLKVALGSLEPTEAVRRVEGSRYP